MSFWTDLQDRFDDLRERATELWQSLVSGGESELGEHEVFDEHEEQEAELADVELELEEIQEEIIAEPDEIEFPDWVSEEDVRDIIEETGVTKYNDLMDSEKDELLPGWQGFEGADEAARERDDYRQEIQEHFDIPENVMDALTDEELMALEQMSSGAFGIAREFEELEPEEAAEELDASFRGTFVDWEAFVQSKLFDFMMDRPDLFDIYVDEEGEVEIYEKDDTP